MKFFHTITVYKEVLPSTLYDTPFKQWPTEAQELARTLVSKHWRYFTELQAEDRKSWLIDAMERYSSITLDEL